MTTAVKTAFSAQKETIEAADRLAAQLNLSRSALISLALKELIKKHDAMRIQEKINDVFSNDPTPEDDALSSFGNAANASLMDTETEEW